MRTVGIRGLLGQVYTIEHGVLARDDANGLIALAGATAGFYYLIAHVNYLTESATCELKVYKSKAKFKNKPERPYQSTTFNVKNWYDAGGISTFSDFDTWFSDDVTKTNGNNEQRRAVDMLKTFTGSSDFEVRNNILNTADYTAFTNTTIQNAD
jgi:hypothetical protein